MEKELDEEGPSTWTSTVSASLSPRDAAHSGDSLKARKILGLNARPGVDTTQAQFAHSSATSE